MSVVIKYKLSDVAKDLNVQNKELIDFLYQTLGESKKHTSPLTEAELNHVFEHYTQKNSEASLDAYLASAPAPKVAEKDIRMLLWSHLEQVLVVALSSMERS